MSFKISQTFNRKRKFDEVYGSGNSLKNKPEEDELVLLIDEDTGEIREEVLKKSGNYDKEVNKEVNKEVKNVQQTKSNPKVLSLSMKKISSDSFM